MFIIYVYHKKIISIHVNKYHKTLYLFENHELYENVATPLRDLNLMNSISHLHVLTSISYLLYVYV